MRFRAPPSPRLLGAGRAPAAEPSPAPVTTPFPKRVRNRRHAVRVENAGWWRAPLIPWARSPWACELARDLRLRTRRLDSFEVSRTVGYIEASWKGWIEALAGSDHPLLVEPSFLGPACPLQVEPDGTLGLWLGGRLGRGAFKTVEEALVTTHSPSPTWVDAVKTSEPIRDDHQRSRVLREGHLLMALAGKPGIVRAFSAHVFALKPGQETYVTLQERCRTDLGTVLRDRMDRAIPFSRDERMAIKSSALQGLLTLDEAKLVHLDLKPENLLLRGSAEGHLEVAVADFGFSRSYDPIDPPRTSAGTPKYFSPELCLALEQRELVSRSPACDVFALGMVFHAVDRLELPFFARSQPCLTSDPWVQRANLYASKTQLEPADMEAHDLHPPDALRTDRDVTRAMLHLAPDARIDARTALTALRAMRTRESELSGEVSEPPEAAGPPR